MVDLYHNLYLTDNTKMYIVLRGVRGRVVRVVNLESRDPLRCGFESRQELRTFQVRKYPASFRNVSARRGS